MPDARIVTATQTAESLRDELVLETPDSQEFRRRMKEKSPCNPLGIEPDITLKTMEQHFMEIMDPNDQDLKTAFEPLKNELQNAPVAHRSWARYSFIKPGQNQSSRPFNVFYSLTKKDNIRMTDVQHMVLFDTPYKRMPNGYYVNNSSLLNNDVLTVNTDRSITITQGGIYLIQVRLKCRNEVSALDSQNIELDSSTSTSIDFNFTVSLQILNARIGPNTELCSGNSCDITAMPLDLHLKDTNYTGTDIRYSNPIINTSFKKSDILNNVTKKFSLTTVLKIQDNERIRLMVERGRLLSNHELILVNETSTNSEIIDDTSHNFGSIGLFNTLPDDTVRTAGREACNYIEIHRLV